MSDRARFDRFEQLARIARGESPPDVDVVDRVLARLRGTVPARPRARLWPLAVAVSTAAAASVLLAAYTLIGFQEPFTEFMISTRGFFS